MSTSSQVEQVMIDPSLALTREGLDVLTDPDLAGLLVISRRFVDLLRSGQMRELQGFSREATPDLLDTLLASVPWEQIRLYSFEDADLSPRSMDTVNRLRDAGLAGEIYADEWAFLLTHSWLALRQGARRTLRAFSRAGIQTFRITHRNLQAFLLHVRQVIPAPVLRSLKSANQAARKHTVLVAAGTSAIGLIPGMGLPTAAAGVLAAGMGVVVGDP